MSTLRTCALLPLYALMSSACGRVGVDLLHPDESSLGDGGALDAALGGNGQQLDATSVDSRDATADASLACTRDRDGDGIPDCQDTCGGDNDAAYVPITSCGVGFCRTDSTPSSCVAGKETACMPGVARSASDTTCDGVDDNCNGTVDENCVTCITHTLAFGVGTYTTNAGACTTLTVKLWGAGGASGDAQGGYWGTNTTGGAGGSGGFTQQTFVVSASSTIAIDVGHGAPGCGPAGTNAQGAYNGGAGATALAADGTAGKDGTVAGANGAHPSAGGNGGNGFFGGGGGGAGASPGYAPFGAGGGGGAASVAVVDSVRLIAGGGGGGGGAGTNVATSGYSGGEGGVGCSGVGVSGAGSSGGGGGGGGVCQGGSTQQRGMGRTPYDAARELPLNTATGGSSTGDCQAGGGGYAIITLSP